MHWLRFPPVVTPSPAGRADRAPLHTCWPRRAKLVVLQHIPSIKQTRARILGCANHRQSVFQMNTIPSSLRLTH